MSTSQISNFTSKMALEALTRYKNEIASSYDDFFFEKSTSWADKST